MLKPTMIARVKVRILVPRVVDSVQRNVGDELEVYEPMARVLEGYKVAERVQASPKSKRTKES